MLNQKKTFYLVGIGGIPNFGDELILITWVKFIRSIHKDAIIWIDTPNPSIISEMFFYLNIDVNITDFIWNLCKISSEKKYISNNKINFIIDSLIVRFRGKNKFYQTTSVANQYKNISEYFKNKKEYSHIFIDNILCNVDSFHVVGGGYINTIWLKNLGIIEICSELKSKYNKPIYFTGLGFLPVLQDNCLIKSKLRMFDVVESRDKLGSDAYEVDFGLDDAFLACKSLPYSGDKLIPDVIICIQRHLVDLKIYNKTIHTLRNRINEYISKGMTIGYIEAFPDSDYSGYIALSDLIPNENYFSLSEVLINGLPLKAKQIWYTSRFHHHLVASANGAQGVVLSFKPGYYDIKHKSLLDLGTDWAFYSPYVHEDLPLPSLNVHYSEKVKKYIEQKEKQALNLYLR
jgi:polysaccharide pyruvyl transferase WcaK-like protein